MSTACQLPATEPGSTWGILNNMSYRSIAFLVCAASAITTSTGRAQAAVKDSLGVTAVVYQGWKMFEVYCTRCDGEDAVG